MHKKNTYHWCYGQIETELPHKLREINGNNTVIASYIREVNNELMKSIPFELAPSSIDDSKARKDWAWKHKFNIKKMSEAMLQNLRNKYDVLKITKALF